MKDTLQALLDAGCAVSFTREPGEGYVASVDAYPGDGSVISHDAIADTPAAALLAAMIGGLLAGGAR